MDGSLRHRGNDVEEQLVGKSFYPKLTPLRTSKDAYAACDWP